MKTPHPASPIYRTRGNEKTPSRGHPTWAKAKTPSPRVRNRGNAPSRKRALVDLPATLNLSRPSSPRHWRAATLEAVKQAWRSPVKLDFPQAWLAASFLAPNRLADGRKGQSMPARPKRPARRDPPQAAGERSGPPHHRSSSTDAAVPRVTPRGAARPLTAFWELGGAGVARENAPRPRPASFSSRDET